MKWVTTIFLFGIMSLLHQTKAQDHDLYTNVHLNDYWVYTPPGYDSNTDLYPVIYYFHGAASVSTDPNTILNWHGPPLLIDDGDWDTSLPFIVVSPHLYKDADIPNSADQRWSMDTLKNVFEEVKLNFRVDTDRVYITGISNGGKAVWDYVQTYPGDVAAAVVFAGNGLLADVCNSSQVPIRAFHGDQDGLIPISGSNDMEYYGPIDMMAALEQCNPAPWTNPLVTVIEGYKHNVWAGTFDKTNGYDIYEYFLNFTRGDFSNVSPYVTAGDEYRKILLPPDEFVINGNAFDYDGSISSYTWDKISGPGVTLAPDTSTLILSDLQTGTYVFRLTVEDNDGATSFDEITLEVVGSISGHAVTDLILMNADTDEDIMTLSDNVQIDFIMLGTSNLNIRSVDVEDGNPVSVRFGLDNNRNFNTIGFASSRRMAKFGGRWTPTVGTHVVSATIFDERNGLGNEGISLFYRINVTNDGVPQPVEFANFSARSVNRGTKLTWKTITEQNNDFFSVQKANEDLEFKTVETISGAGDSSVPIKYSYLDEDIPNTKVFYRIKQTDFDGEFSFSKVISVEPKSSISLDYDYNSKEIVIRNPKENPYSLVLLDINGRTISELNYEQDAKRIYTGSLPEGIYLVKILSADYFEVEKLMISR
jgi:poly(3-hydroxybutyrate) depolymerase